MAISFATVVCSLDNGQSDPFGAADRCRGGSRAGEGLLGGKGPPAHRIFQTQAAFYGLRFIFNFSSTSRRRTWASSQSLGWMLVGLSGAGEPSRSSHWTPWAKQCRRPGCPGGGARGQAETVDVPVGPPLVVRFGETLQSLVELTGATCQAQGMEVPGRLIAGDGLLPPRDGPSGIHRVLLAIEHARARLKASKGSRFSPRRNSTDPGKELVALAISLDKEQAGVAERVIAHGPPLKIGLSVFSRRLVPLA